MTWLPLTAAGALFPAVIFAAASDEVDVALKLLNAGVAGVILILLVKGVFRLSREVEAATDRAEEAEARTKAAEERADREAAARQRIQDAVLADLAPGMLRVSTQGERMVESAAKQSEQMERLVGVVLDLIRSRLG